MLSIQDAKKYVKEQSCNYTRIKTGVTADIIQEIIEAFSLYKGQLKTLANQFDNRKDKISMLKEVWQFARQIEYKEDSKNIQASKSPACVIYQGFADCKGLSMLIGSLLYNLNIPFTFTFTNGSPLDRKPTHVYITAYLNNQKVVLDACLPYFNALPKSYKIFLNSKIFTKMSTEIYRINGVKNRDKIAYKKPGYQYENIDDYIMCNSCNEQPKKQPAKVLIIQNNQIAGMIEKYGVQDKIGLVDDILSVGKDVIDVFGKLFGGGSKELECWTLVQILNFDKTSQTARPERVQAAVSLGYATDSMDYYQKNNLMLSKIATNPNLKPYADFQVCKGETDQNVILALKSLEQKAAQLSVNTGYTGTGVTVLPSGVAVDSQTGLPVQQKSSFPVLPAVGIGLGIAYALGLFNK